MRRLLVTGRHGFVGSTLARMLAAQPGAGSWELATLPDHLDLLDAAATRDCISEARPDAVLHLAAQSLVPQAWRDPEGTLRVNVIGTLHLLEALRHASFTGRMVYVSSGDVYGVVPEALLPVNESQPTAPRNPYAVSKVAAEALCFQWSVSERIDIVIARPFNHIGPGQSEQFVVPALARQIVEIRNGTRPPIVEVGDIDVTRDFTDVRDVIAAYLALLEHGRCGERYNVCSGKERTVRSLLEELTRLADVEVEIRVDPARMRPSEQRRMMGDPSKLRAATGWRATTAIEQSLSRILEALSTNEVAH